MYIYTNEKKLKKYKTMSRWLTAGSFAILIAGAVAAFNEAYIYWSFLALLVGFFISQVSISMTTKWGRVPSTNNIFNVKLKGLSDNFSIYHYMEPVDHLLVGTAGAFILLPYYQGGTISYNTKKDRYVQKKASIFMRIFGQESLGRPDIDADSALDAAQRYFVSKGIDFPADKIHPVVIFLNPRTVIDSDAAFKYDTVQLDKIKDMIRDYAKSDRLEVGFIDSVTDKLPLDDIE